MVDGRLAVACCVTPFLGLAIFYVCALAMNPEVSEIPCGKVMWYTMCIQTGALLLGIPIMLYKKEQLEQLKDLQNLQDPKQFENPVSGPASCLACLINIGMFVNNALLLDQVLNISSECQAQIEGHSIFWHAAQFQAYAFLSTICLIGLLCCCGCCMMCVSSKMG